jgi:hypothetical protein
MSEGFYDMGSMTVLRLALVFFLLSPGVLFRIPPRGSCYVAAAVHAVLFVLLLRLVAPYTAAVAEGFQGTPAKPAAPAKPAMPAAAPPMKA